MLERLSVLSIGISIIISHIVTNNYSLRNFIISMAVGVMDAEAALVRSNTVDGTDGSRHSSNLALSKFNTEDCRTVRERPVSALPN